MLIFLLNTDRIHLYVSQTLQMNLAIVGSRFFNNYNKFKEIVDQYIVDNGFPNKLVSGGAKGVDTMAERYAKEYDIPIEVFKPEWDKLGKKAGIVRNTDIINNATHVLALPSKKSIGTFDSINKAKQQMKLCYTVYID